MFVCKYDTKTECEENYKDCLICVLDKIRTVIEQLRLYKAQFLTDGKKICIDSQEVLDIIDRYRAESEVQDEVSN